MPHADTAPDPTRMRLAAVVVTHDRRDQLSETLTRLLAEPVDHILVVDNDSRDGTRALLSGIDDPRLVPILANRNLGGAGGFELGLRVAVKDFDPDWIAVMDDDARPDPGALEAFRRADLAGWDAVASAVRYPDGRICEMNRPLMNPFWHVSAFLRTVFRGRNGFHLGPVDYSGPVRRVDGASFVGLFLSRQAVARRGYPDADLFIYADDGLYTLGLSRGGSRIGFFPAIRFEHDCTTLTEGRRQIQPLWKVYYYHRNLLFLYRYAAGWLFWPSLAIVLPKWLLRGVGRRGERWRYYQLMWFAIRDGLANRRGQLTSRPQTRHRLTRVLPDLAASPGLTFAKPRCMTDP
jgi:GT2 family glycosyltransferase